MAEQTMTATAKYGTTPMVLADGAETAVPATILNDLTVIPQDRVRLAVRTPLEPFITGVEARATFAAYVLGLSPTVYLRLGDASGNPQDSSGNAYHCDAAANLTYGQTGSIVGDSDKAISFNGSSSYATLPDTADNIDPEYNENFAWAFAIKTSQTTYGDIIAKLPSPSSYMIRTNGADGKLLFSRSDGTNYVNRYTPGAINDGAWHYCIAQRKDGKVRWCVDGTWATTADDPTAATVRNTAKAYIGCRYSAVNYLSGLLDEVILFYDTLPSNDELAALYHIAAAVSPW